MTRAPASASASSTAWASAAPSPGSVPTPISSSTTSVRGVRLARRSARGSPCGPRRSRGSRGCPARRRCRRAPRRRDRRARPRPPARAVRRARSSAASAMAFIATVFPPAFGPESTSTLSRSPSAQVVRHGLVAARSAGGAAAAGADALVADLGRHRVDLPSASAAAREGEVDDVERVEAGLDLVGRARAARSESSRSTRWVSRSTVSSACLWRLFSSTRASGSMKSVVPEREASCTMPRTRPRASARTGST